MASASGSAIPRRVIVIRPSHAFAQICGAVKGLEHGGEVTLSAQTTVKEAVGLLSQEAANFDGLMSFTKPRTEKSRERTRMLARKTFVTGEPYSSDPDAALYPLRLRNTLNAAERPPPN